MRSSCCTTFHSGCKLTISGIVTRRCASPWPYRAAQAAPGWASREPAVQCYPGGAVDVDVGTSGGVWGLERGYCMMIGGEKDVVQRLDPIFAALAPGSGDIPRTPDRPKNKGTAENGYLHCGPNGAGHFVKMVHNGIEYGIMAAYAEGLGVLRDANVGKKQAEVDAETTPLRVPEHYQYDLDLGEIAEVW